MQQPLRPLRAVRGDESGPETPEALVISAMLELGEFRPDRYGLSDSDPACWTKLWHYAVDHQAKVGRAPGLDLVRRQFPDFEITPDVDVAWAAEQLRKASWGRQVRTQVGISISALGDEDYDTAASALEGLGRPTGSARLGLDLFDPSVVAEQVEKPALEVPYPTLQAATGGIQEGDLWYIVARLGQGKTWQLCNYAGHAIKSGARVGYYSLEMTPRRIANRLLTVLAGRDQALLRHLRNSDERERFEALEKLKDRIPGEFRVMGPSGGRVTVDVVRDAMHEFDLVIVDHVGLMSTGGSGRAVDDWRAMAIISNRLKEECLASGTPLLSAAQANREADRSHTKPPKASQISQSDALGQDADVVTTFRQASDSCLLHSAEKVREGPKTAWWTRFEPAKGRFEQITEEQALELGARDEDRLSA